MTTTSDTLHPRRGQCTAIAAPERSPLHAALRTVANDIQNELLPGAARVAIASPTTEMAVCPSVDQARRHRESTYRADEFDSSPT
jgi:hypothetical protein